MTWGTLVVRAHCGPGVGTGHVMRCLALVERWVADGDDVVVVGPEADSPLAARVEQAGGRVASAVPDPGSAADADELVAVAQTEVAHWIVLDGAPFGTGFQNAVRGAGARLLVIDDHGAHGAYDADVVLDQNLGADPERFQDVGEGTRVLLGPAYVLLRREFTTLEHPPRGDRFPRRLVVALGGDPSAEVRAFGDRLVASVEADLPELDVDYPLGGGPSRPWAEVLVAADLAVSAAGTTTWELCHLGVPSVLLAVADDQEPVGPAVAAAGAARWLGRLGTGTVEAAVAAVRALVDDPVERTELARRGAQLVDGRGVARVVTELRAQQLSLRPASLDDARLLWEWASDPIVRAASFDSTAIPWEDHVLWLKDRLADTETTLFLAEDAAGHPVGQIRFAPADSGDLEVGVSVAVEARGRGIAAPLILAGARLVLMPSAHERVHAWIREDNGASRAAFLAAGFVPVGAGTRGGGAVAHLVLERDDLR